MKKYTSGATCAAGVSLAMYNDILFVAFPGGGGLGAATPNYKLNVMPVQIETEPSDSWSFPRLLVLEEETTMEQPALASFNGRLWLAWTGTDPAHRLNLLPLAIGSDYQLTYEKKDKIVFNWTASGGPSLLVFEGNLYLAFSGGGGLGAAAPNGALNVASSVDGLNWPQKQLTVYQQFHSLLSPSLAEFPIPYQGKLTSRLFISFTGQDHFIYLVAADGRAPNVPLKNVEDNDPETSDYAPSLLAYSNSEGWELLCVWTGSGNNRHLYNMGGLGYNNEPGHHEAFSDTSAFAPASVVAAQQIYIAWAGTDAAHRLNIGNYAELEKIPS